MTTVREIINVARAKSLKNKLAEVLIAREQTELLEVVNRAMEGLWMFASAINPSFFASFQSVFSTFVSSSVVYWQRPVEAVQIFYMELTREIAMVQTPFEVVRVPIDRKDLEPDQPAVWLWGKRYYSAGNPNDPIPNDGAGDPGEQITFYYSILPTEAGDIDAELDARWEPQFDELLALEVAIYLALKDDRGGELQGLSEARNAWARRFAHFLEHSDTGLIDSFTPRRTSAEQVDSLMSLLAGGTAAA